MTETIKYRLFQNEDINSIKNLLQLSDLTIADVNDNKIDFIVAVNDANELVGCIGLEQHGEDGLLRSFAVDAAYRGKGIGHELLSRLLSISRQNNINNLHLLTTTAEVFFDRAGFSLSPRNDAPASIKATDEFSSLCPSSCTYMVMSDIQKKEVCVLKDTQIFIKDRESGSDYWTITGKNLMFTCFKLSPNTRFELHKHESEQITYVLEGELCFEIENKTYRLKTGDSIIIPSYTLHRVWTDDQPAKAIDAWSPVNEKYIRVNESKQVQTIKQKI